MKNETNIYDIDGKLIRKAGDNHEFTIQEVQEKLKYYREKLEEEQKSETPDKTRIATYNTYINNLANYVAFKMTQLSNDELADLIGVNNLKKTSKEEVNKALDDTTADTRAENEVSEPENTSDECKTDEKPGNDDTIGRNDGDVQEERPITQSDLLVERDNVNTVMDEYIEVNE